MKVKQANKKYQSPPVSDSMERLKNIQLRYEGISGYVIVNTKKINK